MRRAVRRPVCVGALLGLLALAGCAVAPAPVMTRLPTDAGVSAAATPTASDPPVQSAPASSAADAAVDDDTDCGGRETTVTASDRRVVLTGECPLVRIEASAVTVDASTARVGALSISGDRISVRATRLGDTTVQGNDAVIEISSSVGALSIRGDRNTVSAPDGGGEVRVSGNDNEVRVRASDVAVDGQRNRVG